MALERAVTSGLQQEDQLTGRREDSCHDPVTGRGRRTLIDRAVGPEDQRAPGHPDTWSQHMSPRDP